ncbi:MAG TPA: HD domain-containing protein [Anaerolineae bacterium]|nr:HD domain-containing protein [Anaerolineae bacterium]
MNINRDELVRLTEEYGGAWGINHTRRLLKLIAIIGEGRPYNADALWVAAHLHDWGGYAKWMQAGVDHALRSRQVAEPFLAERNYPADEAKLILECIEFHHSDNTTRCLEVQLLSDADALDFLGVVGVLRDVSKNAKDLRQAYDISRKRRAKLPGLLCLAKSKEIAVQRLADMDDLFVKFEADSFGCF